ncbi:competence/damage-inducible protein A [Haloferax mediterranei ATCC 33500]|uniref:CinA-like domain-containing protein n=1 Tax=Haloferax mediterranei (strain ATCC 33500 / DSM 1411 / JCM 8866 / NBRC 14739 / NCIMB 2177 / R-4) TaxID=523841 RepID=I3R3U3_HALMT|nr:molybdopterin-binding protein [Haloferax mediterranei]AFK18903.1 CinA-like domain-containing protein [Haloferax mediterranei ATCC 33500]AHZ21732.1 damage-inducible protein CinA [Haloferax mediterranei ATCC 33500]EMA03238.1 CinA-like domain-containing protein [Haloferax mediterranei ATCC 33500]MDX5988997.1 molybdopterin-binding protein [Haloferax mediterranei ATCC 33500]QCQ75390.1 competence/damage-inducible protein A [Haloferax mediterranei ATCC 33500]
MQAAVVTVGDELLAGDTVNTNATWLCTELTERGVTVERVTTVPDRVADIARIVNEYHAEYDVVVVTGGLGPTHDDVTMEAVAAAFGRSLERSEDAAEWLETNGGYSATDLVDGTTDLPAGSRMLPNDEGVAPGAVVGSVYVLPGVPGEMKAMFDRVADEFAGEKTHVRFVHTSEPESSLIKRFETVHAQFDVTVGSYPGDHVRVKLAGADEETVDAAAAWLEAQVELFEEE